MTIECIDGRYFVGVWYLSMGSVDHMATIYRDKPGQKWVMKSRVAIDFTGKGGLDREKSWLNGTLPAELTEAEVIAKMDEVYEGMKVTAELAKSSGEEFRIVRVLMQSDSAEKNSQILLSQPWAKAVPMSKGGAG